MHHGRESVSNGYTLRRPHVSYDEYTRFAAWQLADLSLFSHAPHILRPHIYNDQSMAPANAVRPRRYERAPALSCQRRRCAPRICRAADTGLDEPVYKYIHVGIPHRPVTIERQLRFHRSRSCDARDLQGQAQCAVRRLVAILDRLKKLGVYDDSFVVISSDHGIGTAPRSLSTTGRRRWARCRPLRGNRWRCSL